MGERHSGNLKGWGRTQRAHQERPKRRQYGETHTKINIITEHKLLVQLLDYNDIINTVPEVWYPSLSDHPNQTAQKQIYHQNPCHYQWFDAYFFCFFKEIITYCACKSDTNASVMVWPHCPINLMSQDGLTKLYFYDKIWCLSSIWGAHHYLTCGKNGLGFYFFL